MKVLAKASIKLESVRFLFSLTSLWIRKSAPFKWAVLQQCKASVSSESSPFHFNTSHLHFSGSFSPLCNSAAENSSPQCNVSPSHGQALSFRGGNLSGVSLRWDGRGKKIPKKWKKEKDTAEVPQTLCHSLWKWQKVAAKKKSEAWDIVWTWSDCRSRSSSQLLLRAAGWVLPSFWGLRKVRQMHHSHH